MILKYGILNVTVVFFLDPERSMGVVSPRAFPVDTAKFVAFLLTFRVLTQVNFTCSVQFLAVILLGWSLYHLPPRSDKISQYPFISR